ncbi:TPA: LysR family transcriptional regulator, partial [Legionella pneumophila]|nr:LysR family transcriptional regulator [Legionella pneumophila]
NPKLQIKIELAERFPDLAQESIDVLFGVSMEGPPELVRKRVSATRYVLCASPDYLANNGIPKIPSDLAKHRYITHSMRNPDNLVTFKGDEQIYVEPVLWLNDSRALCECAMLGMGIIKLHEYIVAEALQDGRLIEILPEFQEPHLSVYLYYQASRYLQPKIRRFIDFFTK